MLGSFLNLKPILSIEGGETGVKATPRGGAGAFEKMVELYEGRYFTWQYNQSRHCSSCDGSGKSRDGEAEN